MKHVDLMLCLFLCCQASLADNYCYIYYIRADTEVLSRYDGELPEYTKKQLEDAVAFERRDLGIFHPSDDEVEHIVKSLKPLFKTQGLGGIGRIQAYFEKHHGLSDHGGLRVYIEHQEGLYPYVVDRILSKAKTDRGYYLSINRCYSVTEIPQHKAKDMHTIYKAN